MSDKFNMTEALELWEFKKRSTKEEYEEFWQFVEEDLMARTIKLIKKITEEFIS